MRSSAFTALLAATAAALLATPARTQGQRIDGLAIQTVGGRDAVANEVIVKLRGSAPAGSLRGDLDADRMEPIGRAAFLRVRSRSLDVPALLARLAQRSDIEYAEPNFVVRAISLPNDPRLPELWGLQNSGQSISDVPGVPAADIHATEAWEITVGSTANVVAVIDTGVDYNHPDLAANMWTAPTAFTVTIGGSTITCAAGSHGFNAIKRNCNPMDDHNHGTHVSGTIGATGNNGVGVVGVNWTTRIVGIKFLDRNGSGTVADAIDGIQFAIELKRAFAATSGANVRVLSNSWGGAPFSQALLDAIEAANAEDMLFVAAAGNSSMNTDVFPDYPASFEAPNVVAVAATTNTDDLAWFSNYGASSVDLAAPGSDILSTTVGNRYEYFSGTSMAAPHVSGAAALLLSQCDLDTPGLKDALVGTGESVPSLAGLVLTSARLDVNSAIHSCIAPPPTPVGLMASSGNGQVTLSWSASLGATRYVVKRGTSPGGPYIVLDANNIGPGYSDAAVANGTTYYYVVSAANPQGESSDSNEASAIPNAPSDLVVSTLTVPSTGGPGSTIAVEVTTKNQGAGPAAPSTTRLYFSDNYLLDSTDSLLSPEQSVPALAAGAVGTATLTVTIPGNAGVGGHYIIAEADAENVLTESLESNNKTVRIIQVGPDLIMSALTVPATGTAGAAVALSSTVKNQGGGAAAPSTTKFYLSANSALDTSDVLLPGAQSVPALAAGSSSAGSVSVTLPASTAVGTYYVIAKADADGAVAETQEINNTTARTIRIGGDLTVSAFTAPSTAGAGATIVVSDTTANIGTGPTAGSVTRFYLSTNALLDAADTVLNGSRAVPALNAGASSTGSTTLTIPSGTTSGGYYLLAKADAGDEVVETQETNNTSARYVQVGGDLVISALTVPATGGAGGSITISDTTRNQGSGVVATSVTRFYVSVNSVFDATDTLLPGGRAVPELDPSASSTGSTVLTIPPSTATGLYYVIAKADADGTVAETQEINNTTARSIRIGPDLVESNVSISSSKVSAGARLTATDTALNQGGGAAGASTTRFYLSSNATFDSSDLALAEVRLVPALGAGASSTGSTAITIPTGTSPGYYYLLTVADGDNAVAESLETNNSTARFVRITAP